MASGAIVRMYANSEVEIGSLAVSAGQDHVHPSRTTGSLEDANITASTRLSLRAGAMIVSPTGAYQTALGL